MPHRLGLLLAGVDGAGDGMFAAMIPARSAPVRRASRRDFLRMSAAIAGGLGLPGSVARASAITRASANVSPVPSSLSAGGDGDAEPSDVGSLYPFIRSQAWDGMPATLYTESSLSVAAAMATRRQGRLLETSCVTTLL